MNTIRKRRKKLNMSQTDLAKRLQLDQTAVSKWETGQAMPRADKLPALAGILHCPIDDLYIKEEGAPEKMGAKA